MLKSPCQTYFESKSPKELSHLAHVKRFIECYSGDKEFRETLKDGNLDDLARSRGIELQDVDSLRPVFDEELSHFRQDATKETWPLTAIWNEYLGALFQGLSFYAWSGDSDGITPHYDAWRQKQMIRTVYDVGASAKGIIHPPVAYELSDGCSVGCWFCGISAKEFKGHFPVENGGLQFWKEILQATQSVFGRGMSIGFCYWATEPLDHPDYPKFLETYFDVTGVIPQTTTAIPLRDVSLTREVLGLWKKSMFVPNRFSVLTTPILRRIHKTFAPEELMGVELVQQSADSVAPKSIAGRALTEKGARKIEIQETKAQQGTIACVSGFLVNLPKKTVRLVSPTLPSEEWPNGYYVYRTEDFVDAQDLELKMQQMLASETSRSLDCNQPLTLNSKYWFEAEGGTQRLRNDLFGIEMDIFSAIGPMLQSGGHSPNEILKKAVVEGHDPILAIKVINDLSNTGLTGDTLRPLHASV